MNEHALEGKVYRSVATVANLLPKTRLRVIALGRRNEDVRETNRLADTCLRMTDAVNDLTYPNRYAP